MRISKILEYNKPLYDHLVGFDVHYGKQLHRELSIAAEPQHRTQLWQELMALDVSLDDISLYIAHSLLMAQRNKPWSDADVAPPPKYDYKYNCLAPIALPLAWGLFKCIPDAFLAVTVIFFTLFFIGLFFVKKNREWAKQLEEEPDCLFGRLNELARIQKIPLTRPGTFSYHSYAIVRVLDFVYEVQAAEAARQREIAEAEAARRRQIAEAEAARRRQIAEAEAARKRQLAEAEAARQRQIAEAAAEQQRQARRRRQQAAVGATAAAAALPVAAQYDYIDDDDDSSGIHISYNPANGFPVIDSSPVDVGGHVVGAWDGGGWDSGGWDEW